MKYFKHWFVRIIGLIGFIIVASLTSTAQQSVDASSSYIDKNGFDIPNEIIDILSISTEDPMAKIPHRNRFIIDNWNRQGSWALFSIAPQDDEMLNGVTYDGMNSTLMVLAFQSANGTWSIAIEGTPTFTDFVNRSPDTLIQSKAKKILIESFSNVSASVVNYKFPWSSTEQWQLSPNISALWHAATSTMSSIDLGRTGGDHRVLNAAEGVITKVCIGSISVNINIRHADGVNLRYDHINKTGFDTTNITLGALLPQGYVLGTLRSGTWSDSLPMCYSSSFTDQDPPYAHLHWTFPINRTFVIDGWTVQPNIRYFERNGEQRHYRAFFESSNVPLNTSFPCPGPSLSSPANGSLQENSTVSFAWNTVNCFFSGFELRIKTIPDMDTGGEQILTVVEPSTQRSLTIPQQWHNRDLYWSVRATNTPNGAAWGTARQFRVVSNPPTISFNTANGSTAGSIESRDQTWTFAGTAAAPGSQLSRIAMQCSGDQCGNEVAHVDGTVWSHTQQGMLGRNTISFLVSTVQGLVTVSRQVELKIDLAAPQTTLSLNSESTPIRWPSWYRLPVTVRLQSIDQATLTARSDIDRIMYRLDGGVWQNGGGGPVSLTVISDGSHTIEYYAVDRVGNQEIVRSATFKIDRTAPPVISSVQETSGIVSGEWQKSVSTPTFTWNAVTDSASGLWGYQLYFGLDANGIGNQSFRASATRQWTPQPQGVRTGTYYLRIRTADLAGDILDTPGNWSAWTTAFTFRYDGTPPENPSNIVHTSPITNNVWQRIDARPNFSWPVPKDEGSGINGYQIYWGKTADGTNTTFQTSPSFQSPIPLCAMNSACTGYLRLRSRDRVGNEATNWTTAYVLQYDNVAPAVTFRINNGITQTNQTLITLHIDGSDIGSGVQQMRLSNDGQTWFPWEAYQHERQWAIPSISRQTWPIYLQVRDGVQLESAVVSQTIYLDVNIRQPRSANYRLFDHSLNAGSASHSSATYQGHSTVGQVIDTAQTMSRNYSLRGGYEAGSQAVPIIEPGHDTFSFINGIVASGPNPDRMRSSRYSMLGTIAEPALPNNKTTLVSNAYQHQPGFLAARPTLAPIVLPPQPPQPPAEPIRPCEFPHISINNGSVFTQNVNVILSICAPRAVEMKISNDGGFSTAQWQPYTQTKEWVLTTHGQYVLPRYVYAAFKDANGTIHSIYFDDIILDPTPPRGSVSVGNNTPSSDIRTIAKTAMNIPRTFNLKTDGSLDLYINGQDDNSGIAEMQISTTPLFTNAVWEPYLDVRPWIPQDSDGITTVYVRFRDSAGNISNVAQTTFKLDRTPPTGMLDIQQGSFGIDAVTATLVLSGSDHLSGISDMRISANSDLQGTDWQPYVSTLSWPVFLTTLDSATFYIQYRDGAGNTSDVYSNTLMVDRIAPFLDVVIDSSVGLTRTLTINAYDNQSAVTRIYLSNDPLMLTDRVSQPYTETIQWSFDERRVVWVQVEDSSGNRTEAHPVYAHDQVPIGQKIYLPLITR